MPALPRMLVAAPITEDKRDLIAGAVGHRATGIGPSVTFEWLKPALGHAFARSLVGTDVLSPHTMAEADAALRNLETTLFVFPGGIVGTLTGIVVRLRARPPPSPP